MSTALEAASLIMIPTSYSDGLLASVKPNDGAGDFTFSRGSNISATRVNADGNIEKGYENLLLQSNNFSTTWFNSNSTETSGQGGYDGSSDAWLISKSAAGGYIGQNISQSGVQTFSIYAKANDSDYMSVIGSAYQVFNLSNGTLGVGNAIDAKIESIGSGWYRCSMTENASITRVRIFPVEANSSSATSGSIYIQDAMLNQGLVAYPYVETTTAPVAAGILEDTPRIDFSGGNQSLLLEPSRTNLFPQSELSSILDSSPNLTKADNAALSPEGVQNAMEFIPSTAFTNAHYCITTAANNLIAGAKYTFSAYVKPNGFNYVQVGGYYGNETAFFNLSTGTLISLASNASSGNISSVGNGWYRCDVTYTFQNAIGNFVSYAGFKIYEDEAKSYYSGDGVKSIYAYGLQLEQDATYPTSYIPTYGVSQTRLDEYNAMNVGVVGTFSTLTSGESGTAFIETKIESLVNNRFNLISNGGSLNWFYQGNNFYAYRTGGVLQWGLLPNVSTFEGTSVKFAFKKAGLDVTLFINGQNYGTNSLQVGQDFSLYYRYLSTYLTSQSVSKYIEFPTALSDEECITLTTI